MTIASFKAGESISAGDAVFVSNGGFAFKALADTAEKASVVGVAINGGSAGELIQVNLDSIYTSSSSYTPPEPLYLSLLSSGTYENYETFASGLASTSYIGGYLTNIGTAVSTNKISVEVSPPTFIVNPTSVFLLEGSFGITIDAILQEDGSTIKTEDAA